MNIILAIVLLIGYLSLSIADLRTKSVSLLHICIIGVVSILTAVFSQQLNSKIVWNMVCGLGAGAVLFLLLSLPGLMGKADGLMFVITGCATGVVTLIQVFVLSITLLSVYAVVFLFIKYIFMKIAEIKKTREKNVTLRAVILEDGTLEDGTLGDRTIIKSIGKVCNSKQEIPYIPFLWLSVLGVIICG